MIAYNVSHTLFPALQCITQQTLKQLSTHDVIRGDLLTKANASRVLLDLLQHGDEYCKAHAAETVANLATDEPSLEVLAAGGEQLMPMLIELVCVLV